ncbi:adenylate isopentenyltransferase-like [Mercurialis annua]|uniref:adenylate isopentenyltransferase-like n=1 Tax=Mercurialis annua TaxID=3986 RepID=UPI002160362C|nr:adenylate isopentenyltransferase-like [Mercurialis annua]
MKFHFSYSAAISHISVPVFSSKPHSSPRRRLPPPPRWVRMESSSSSSSAAAQKDGKIVVIMGATGCGKTKLSIDLATKFQSEIINSDKMQVYNGLDITTNKITLQERHGVTHHLLGDIDPVGHEFSPADFRFHAGLAVSDILSRHKLPLLVGGSNSFIHSLLVDRFNPELDVFDSTNSVISTQLRYNCRILWVDVSLPLLCEYLCKRVDEMLDSGMFEELLEYYDSVNPASQPGLRKAIGVPEFERYFKKYPPGYGGEWDKVRRGVYEEAVRMIKDNTCQLAKRQMGKIMRLKNAGWDLQRVDATAAFREVMRNESDDEEDGDDIKRNSKNNNYYYYNNNNNCYYYNENNNNNNVIVIKKKKKRRKRKKWMEIWERDVLKPSMKIVNNFLDE